ncbi:2-hydroxyacid dehydrogenase [Azospirillum sp. sgz301742]
MTVDILAVEPLMHEAMAVLEQRYAVHRLWQAPDRAAFVAGLADRVRGVVTGGGTGISNDVLNALPKLEIISVNGVGTDKIDLDLCRRRGIRVCTTLGTLTDDVADMAFGLMLAVTRRLAQGDRFVRAGGWLNGGLPLGRKLTGKRLGIFGLGQIGRAIAKRAAGFAMDVSYVNRSPVEGVSYRAVGDIVELAKSVDILVIAASASAETKGIIGRAVLDALGPEGVLVNVARGSLIDEPELVAALSEGRLGGAGLDVFADEPRVPAALFTLDNVVLEPHQASATLETRRAMGALVLGNLEDHFAGREPRTAIV